jgi:cell cycle checkpoint protein
MQLGSDVWAERFAPRASSDLAVHKDKVKELKEWIELNRSHLQRGSTAGQRLLLLRGPSGSGKTAMVKVAAAGWQVFVLEPSLRVPVCSCGSASMPTRVCAHTRTHMFKASPSPSPSPPLASEYTHVQRHAESLSLPPPLALALALALARSLALSLSLSRAHRGAHAGN